MLSGEGMQKCFEVSLVQSFSISKFPCEYKYELWYLTQEEPQNRHLPVVCQLSIQYLQLVSCKLSAIAHSICSVTKFSPHFQRHQRVMLFFRHFLQGSSLKNLAVIAYTLR